MQEITKSLSELVGKVAENSGEIAKEGAINRALIDALIATLLARGVLSPSDFDHFYKIGQGLGDGEVSNRITSRLDTIKKAAKL